MRVFGIAFEDFQDLNLVRAVLFDLLFHLHLEKGLLTVLVVEVEAGRNDVLLANSTLHQQCSIYHFLHPLKATNLPFHLLNLLVQVSVSLAHLA